MQNLAKANAESGRQDHTDGIQTIVDEAKPRAHNRAAFAKEAIQNAPLVGWIPGHSDSGPEVAVVGVKKRIAASLGFRSTEGACRTIEGYEAMHAIRKGQVRWVAKGDAVAQWQFIHSIFGIAA